LRNFTKTSFPKGKKNQKKESTNGITLTIFYAQFNLLAEIETLYSCEVQKVEVQQAKSPYSSNGLTYSKAKDHFVICISFNHSVVLFCSAWSLKC